MTGQNLRQAVLDACPRLIGDVLFNSVRWPQAPTLLGESLKVTKGVKKGVLTAVMYLAAADRSRVYGGADLCPHSTPGCRKACLGHTSGRLVMGSAQNAQIWKTLAFLHVRQWFLAKLHEEIGQHEARAHRKGLIPAVRLNGTSDLAWERLAPGLFADYPRVQFYDYTKDGGRALQHGLNTNPDNYHLTYSLSEEDKPALGPAMLLRHDCNVAVVFRTRDPADFPATWQGFPVLNGDETDVRFYDPPGHVVGLTAKGTAIRDTTGFVQELDR